MVDFTWLLFKTHCPNSVDSGRKTYVNPKLGINSSTLIIYNCDLTNKECSLLKDCPKKEEVK